MSATSFDYSNLSGRPVTPFVRYAGWLLPGVRRVQRQVTPYAAAWEQHNQDMLVDADGAPVWVALGDSMTQGIGASAWDRGWVGQLMPTLPHRVVNLSFNGARVADVVERQLPALARVCELLARDPELVTVMIGSNDLVSRTWRPLLPGSTARMLALLPERTVVANQPGEGRPSAAEFNALIDTAARSGAIRLADFRDPRMRSWRGKVAEDHFHPNDRGYAGIAALMGEAIRAD